MQGHRLSKKADQSIVYGSSSTRSQIRPKFLRTSVLNGREDKGRPHFIDRILLLLDNVHIYIHWNTQALHPAIGDRPYVHVIDSDNRNTHPANLIKTEK